MMTLQDLIFNIYLQTCSHLLYLKIIEQNVCCVKDCGHVASFVLCVCFVDRCLSFLFWPLCCLFSFDLRFLITHLVSSNSFSSERNIKISASSSEVSQIFSHFILKSTLKRTHVTLFLLVAYFKHVKISTYHE